MTGRLRDILPSIGALLEVPGATDALGLRERHGPRRRVALVLVDGLGLELLPALASVAPLLAAARPVELSSPFPSTTPTSLVTLGTGADPGEHGVLGFTLAVPGDPSDRVLTHIRWRDDPPPRQWQPLPTWFGRMAARVVLPAEFVGSGLTDAAYRDASVWPVARGVDPAARLVDGLSADGLTFGYVAMLDTAAHGHGIGSPEWLAAAAEVDAYLTRIVERLPTDVLLLVTADHGGLNGVDRVDVAEQPELVRGVRVLAGEPRARYVHVTRPDAAADVADAWRSVLGERADVRLRDDAIAAGWFGPVPDAHRDRIGDVVAVCRGDTVVLASDREPPEVTRLIGFHGGRDRVETAIPLLTFER